MIGKIKELSQYELTGQGKLVFGLVFVTLLISIGLGLSYYSQRQAKRDVLGSSFEIPETELTAQDVVNGVGKLVLLPEEEVHVAKITKKSELPDQEFFRQVEEGDRLLVYKISKKIILYRPSIKKVVDIAPLEFEEKKKEEPVATDSAEEAPPEVHNPKVLYQGELLR